MKKKIFVFLSCLLLSVSGYLAIRSLCNVESVFDDNVEALASSESEVGQKCGGCSTDKTVFCCHIIIENVGGWFLYKD